MKIRNNVALTFIFALLVCWVFQTLPVIAVSDLQAEELPMPTYDRDLTDPDNPKIYPDLEYYDGYVFRTVECKINLIVDIEDINALFEGTGWNAFPFGPGIEEGETTVEVSWTYRIFSQWPTISEYNGSTHEMIGGVSFGTLARNPGVKGLGFLIFADVRSPGNAVDLNNATVGDGAEVSREGHLEIDFKSKSKPDSEGTLKFKAMVREPISGLNVKVNATLPEGQEATRVVRNPLSQFILFMDLSTPSATEGLRFNWWLQQDRYDFDETTQDYKLEVEIPHHKLKLPGNRVLPVKRVHGSFSLRRNVEGYLQFID
jgi:hypothetical protein